MDEQDRLKKGVKPPRPGDWNEQMYRMRVFGVLTRDTDRNLTNVLITPEWQVMMIDFTRAFRLHKDLPYPQDLQRCDRSLMAAMKTLTREGIKAAVRDDLTNSEINAVIARRDLLVAHFERLIAEKGEKEVLYQANRVQSRRQRSAPCALFAYRSPWYCCAWPCRLGGTEVPPYGSPYASQDKPADDGFTLKTAETIEFTTDEVTWMQLDVSPDGRTILFDLLGDLYTMPIGGGEATRIIGGLSFESQPTWSPDGQAIAFLTDRTGVENLWIADADGSNPRAVSKDGKTNDRPQIMVSPAWTPDGQYIVVSKSRPPDPGTFWLFLYHRDGGTGVRVGAPPAAAARTRGAGPAATAAAQPHGRGGVARRPLHLLRPAHGELHLQRALPAVAGVPPRPRDRRRHAGDQCAGQRHAAHALARRQVAGVRHAPQDRHGAARPQPRDRRRALAGLSGDARRPGIARQPRHPAPLRLHARRPLADRPHRRQAPDASTSRAARRTPIPFTARCRPRSRRACTRPCAWTTAPWCARD